MIALASPAPVRNYAVRSVHSSCSCSCVSAGSERPKVPSAKERDFSLVPVRDPALHVRFQEAANWVTPAGVAKKRRHIESLGLPDMKGRRFITLSFDRKLFGDCPLTAYLAGREHMRRFLEAGRVAGLWQRGCWWAWKLEFQRDGWAHWHLILDRTAKFSNADMLKIRDIWGLGRTNCRRISKSHFGYAFKYVFKGVFQDDDDSEMCLPFWFLNYYRAAYPVENPDGELEMVKPDSFSRVRFWQTSKGFYTGKTPTPSKSVEPSSSYLPRPLREAIHDRENSVVVIARKGDGQYLQSRKVRLHSDRQHFISRHLWAVDNQQGFTLSSSSFCLDTTTIKQTINKIDLWKLQPLQQSNRLTLRRARFLRLHRINLHHC